MATLYLLETHARRDYSCAACQRPIRRGSLYFRHDPFPAARIHRGQKTTHWCRECITAADPGPKDSITKRLWVPAVRVLGSGPSAAREQEDLFTAVPLQIEVVGIGHPLAKILEEEPSAIHRLSPAQFEEFVCDRLSAMGLEPQRVGPINQKDGGIDIVFWPRHKGVFPFLGAAQVKHHRDPRIIEGPSTVREFAGAIAGHPFSAGMIVTNSSFSPDARWFARERAKLLRLRDFDDIRRWIASNFADDEEWREIPSTIELCPGIVIKVR